MIDNSNFFGFTREQVIDTNSERLALMLNWMIALLVSNECQGRSRDQYKDRHHLILRKYKIQQRFTWLSEREIKYCLDQLVKKGIIENKIVVAEYYEETNKCHMITLTHKFYEKYITSQIDEQNCQTNKQNCQTVPYINKNKKEDDKSKVSAILSTQSQKEVEDQPPKESSSNFKLLDIWNRKCINSGLPKFELTFENRRQVEIDLKLLNLSENQFSEYLDKIMSTPFLMGQIAGYKAATFDWIIKQQNYQNIKMGKYAPRATTSEDALITEIEANMRRGSSAWARIKEFLSPEAFEVVDGEWTKLFAQKGEVATRKYIKQLIKRSSKR